MEEELSLDKIRNMTLLGYKFFLAGKKYKAEEEKKESKKRKRKAKRGA